jgi:DNA-binding Lrp family transcriptional regulator
MEEVAQALVARHEVRYLSATAGYSDLTAEVILPDLDRLYDFLTGVVGSLPGVRRSEVGLELTTVKRNYET